MAAPGSLSEGFNMKVLPHAIASGNIHKGIMAGKLNGQMPATTPRGCRSVQFVVEQRVSVISKTLATVGN